VAEPIGLLNRLHHRGGLHLKPCQARLAVVSIAQEPIRVQVTAMAPSACCPRCAVPSSSVHSRDQRHLTDLPWGALSVRIQLIVRKFICRQPACPRRIFTERLPNLVVGPY
jgi:transposase